MQLLIIDNYDSFTYNLVELVRQTSTITFEVITNDKVDIQVVDRFDKILISPGPGLPEQAGLICEIISQYAPVKDILGICLGHQAIAKVFGGSLYNLSQVFHGITGDIIVNEPEFSLFKDIPAVFKAGLYHSWAVSAKDLPDCLATVAVSTEGVVMGLKHKHFRVAGLQFHPESVMTSYGKEIMRNWLGNNIL